jgi:hypothetical protein
MKTLTIKSDLINKKIQLLYGFEVDYNPTLKENIRIKILCCAFSR